MFTFDVLFTFPFAAVILTARPNLGALTHLAPYNSSLAGNATVSSSYDSSYDPMAPLETASAGLSTALFVALLVLLKLVGSWVGTARKLGRSSFQEAG